ncbi:hypothetical protein SLS62_006535 [Diatrype stigma]|uniref:Uncharacterized protein n=1 Tax=Diatrype stigma TaxID=117547 RepID=A0AAN9USH2_9PEZI
MSGEPLPPTTTTDMPHDSNDSVSIGARRDCCSCLQRMMSTYEMVEIRLVWAPRDESRALPLGADEMLRYQKEALVSCESILRCEACSLEPEQVMLLISICNKLLASIVEMRHTLLTTMTTTAAVDSCERQQAARDRGLDSRHSACASAAATLKQQQLQQPQTQHQRQQQQRWPPAISVPAAPKLPPPVVAHQHRHGYALDSGQQQEWPTTTTAGKGSGYDNCTADDCGNDSMGLDLDLDFDLETHNRRRASVLSIDHHQWGWRIDDEDKLQILKSLSDDRARRLENLVRRMGDVVAVAAAAAEEEEEEEEPSSSRNRNRSRGRSGWVAHRSMIRDLAERLAKEIEMGYDRCMSTF